MSLPKLLVMALISLTTGMFIAGGIYVANTPTNFSTSNQPKQIKVLGTSTTKSATSGQKVTENYIKKSFGTKNKDADINHDGRVDILDLLQFQNSQK